MIVSENFEKQHYYQEEFLKYPLITDIESLRLIRERSQKGDREAKRFLSKISSLISKSQ